MIAPDQLDHLHIGRLQFEQFGHCRQWFRYPEIEDDKVERRKSSPRATLQ
jgi:hypothetical protein